MSPTPQEPSRETHLRCLREALSLARRSPPKPTNFRVGCVLVSHATAPAPAPTTASGPATAAAGAAVDALRSGPASEPASSDLHILSTGYTLELEGNTHAEQNALAKLARQHGLSPISSSSSSLLETQLGEQVLTPELNVYLYTTLEPCGKRLSGNTPCVRRIIATRSGAGNGGIQKVVFGAREPGTFVQDSRSLKMLDEAGVPWEFVPGLEDEILSVAMEGHVKAAPVDALSPEERLRQEQEAQPRNPKKRMMEVDLSR